MQQLTFPWANKERPEMCQRQGCKSSPFIKGGIFCADHRAAFPPTAAQKQ